VYFDYFAIKNSVLRRPPSGLAFSVSKFQLSAFCFAIIALPPAMLWPVIPDALAEDINRRRQLPQQADLIYFRQSNQGAGIGNDNHWR